MREPTSCCSFEDCFAMRDSDQSVFLIAPSLLLGLSSCPAAARPIGRRIIRRHTNVSPARHENRICVPGRSALRRNNKNRLLTCPAVSAAITVIEAVIMVQKLW
jgi:hypothetical protein